MPASSPGIPPGESSEQAFQASQYDSLLRQVPFVYLIGTFNSIMLARTFVGVAPSWLTFICPTFMSAATLLRAASWLRQRRGAALSPAAIARRLGISRFLTIVLSVIFVGWALSLFSYGDALLQLHVAFYVVVTGIGCAFCLVAVPIAAITMISILLLACATALMMTERAIFINEVLDILLVYGILVFAFLACHRHLKSLTASRQEVVIRSEEIAALHDLAQEQDRRRVAERRASIDQIVSEFSGSIESVSLALAQITDLNRSQSRDLAADSEAALRRVEDVEQAARCARANLDQVLESAGSMLDAIGFVHDQTSRTMQISDLVERKTDKALASMNLLHQHVGDVDKMTDLITQVTHQINLIALNATIEAARAGEAGRGFAVVATEIKTLAAATARATNTIVGQVVGIKAASADAHKGVEDLNCTFVELKEAAKAMAAASTRQADVTGAIRGFADVALRGAENVDVGMGDMRRAAATNHASALSMLDRCERTNDEAAKLGGSVRRFLAFVQTA